MYHIRDNILESLDEWIIAVAENGTVQFANNIAVEIFNNIEKVPDKNLVGQPLAEIHGGDVMIRSLDRTEKEFHIIETVFGKPFTFDRSRMALEKFIAQTDVLK